ncbi:MAG: U32 family peptidase C-terminal domain-containing protein, partial [Gammaproteobacteria bacterium]|nr:U32 family peptidase C-terminal domain-containing protein [Gammaproteobacteria bacterium]
RCLLSGYFNHRDANQGSCTNSCRWDYDVKKAETNITGDVMAKNLNPAASEVYLLEEKERPGELMPIEEDEHGTYIMNSKDLRAVEHVERLVKLGVDSLKIEGRTKSHYYVARSTQVYRKAIDDAVAGRTFNPALLGELENLANRGYTDGFFERHHTQDYQNYMDSHSKSYQQRFVGEVVNFTDGMAEIEAKNKFAIGDEMELILPTQNRKFILEHVEDMKGKSMQEVPGGGYRIRIPLEAGEYEMGLLARNEN